MKDATDGKVYLYVYAKVGESGAAICGRIPESIISGSVKNIRTASVIAVILATVVSSLVGIIVSNSIGSTVKGISNGFEQAAKGDLTVTINSKRRQGRILRLASYHRSRGAASCFSCSACVFIG